MTVASLLDREVELQPFEVFHFKKPLKPDNRTLVAFLGREPHTPIDTALRETLTGLGCMSA